ncbi:MAG: hypothetical protein V4653_09400 [Pseudomonadota bacterium]
MERDPDIRTLALRMNSRQFPYRDFANPAIRTSLAAEPTTPEPATPGEPERAAVTSPPWSGVPGVALAQAPSTTLMLTTPYPVAPPVRQPSMTAAAAPAAWFPPPAPLPQPAAGDLPQALQTSPLVAALPSRLSAPHQPPSADFPLILNALQEVRDLAPPAATAAGGVGTADWLRARASAAQG